ncbi:MAG: hypothetical protein ACOY4D_13205 [Pseudomonadota bacterium]
MERNPAPNIRRILTSLCCIACLWLTFGYASAAEAQRMVLVAGATSYIPSLTPAEVRKLFLGIVIVKDSLRIEPLINLTDHRLHQMFLQKMVFMSSYNYEHHLVTHTRQTGDPLPQEYTDPWQLISALRSRPGSITYMWAKDAQPRMGLRIVQELWPSQPE